MRNISEYCTQDVPFLATDRYLLPFERNFDYWGAFHWYTNNWWLCFYFIGAYLLAIAAGQRFMRSRQPFDLRVPIILWNALLALVSSSALVRLFPMIMTSLEEDGGFYGTMCAPSFTERKMSGGFWVNLFLIFKVVELGDTAFVVLRKKPLIFLHWYHHATVMFFSWVSGAYPSTIQQHFMMVNMAMHAMVYSYYTLKALRVPIPRRVNIAITSMQILEMMFGVFTAWSAHRLKARNPGCCVFEQYISIAAAIYVSYLVLFVNFFIKSYISNKGVLFDERGAIKKIA